MRVRLLHWKESEAKPYIETLRKAGYHVDYDEQFRPALIKACRESPPDAFLIDLSRMPSHGREIAIALRQSPRTRAVPIVFCGGDEEKVARIRSELPDAAYCALSKLRSTLRTALANRLADPVKPVQMMDRYASRSASTVRLIEPPRNAVQALGDLPHNVEILDDDSTGTASVTLCFLHKADSLLPTLSRVRGLARTSKLWILWRKGGSAARGDVTEGSLRQKAIDLGLVEYKICSVNTVWSAMLFAAKR